MKWLKMSDIQNVLDFWLEEVGPDGWYVASDEVDERIRDRFGALVERAKRGELDEWRETADGSLAILILLDQFSRNLHRGKAEAFAADAQARDIARTAIAQNQDMEIAQPGRQFFYLPFEHSENLADQDWSIALFTARMDTMSETMMWHVEQHRETIRRFGRFPFRNEALGRTSTEEEAAFLSEGSYAPGTKV